ncbi:hypothetical protein VNI00_017137 [Paramarasmius palmivorus]|uniref:CxC2-like cysteine cluster KDZ transposase-associated domain-containing protein n=1 Tax=Paramarasmius palmivorus TaxID=297713 RepID=A0AAW0B8F6_9AGAR
MLWCIVPEAGKLSTGTRKLTLSSTYHPADGEVLYYKVDYKKGFIADPAAMIERTSTSEAKQTRDSRYHSNIMKRNEVEVYHEGKRYKYPYCVLSQSYIAFMTGGEIEKIDNICNGLLVLKQLHTCLGASSEGKNKTPPVCSFLKVPNRFLKRSHIKISKKQPDLDKIPPAKSSPTVHFHVLSVMAKLYAPPLCDMLINKGQIWDRKLVRQPLPENHEEKILGSLLNYHYGCVALTVFAQRDVGNFQKFSKTVQEIYDLGGGPYMDKKSGKDWKRGGGGGGEGEQGEEGAGDKGKGKAAQNQEEDVEQSEIGFVDTLWALSALAITEGVATLMVHDEDGAITSAESADSSKHSCQGDGSDREGVGGSAEDWVGGNREDWVGLAAPMGPTMLSDAARKEQYLKEWLGLRDDYLKVLLIGEGRGESPPNICGSCNKKGSDPKFRCRDCFSVKLFCKECILECHRDSPLDIIEMWNGQFFERIMLADLGLVIQLGHLSNVPCPAPNTSTPKNFTVIHTNGFHRVHIHYCQCPKGGRMPHMREQLLAHWWYPATTKVP